MGFEKALGAVKVIKDQMQYRSQSLLNLARGYFTPKTANNFIILILYLFFLLASPVIHFAFTEEDIISAIYEETIICFLENYNNKRNCPAG